VEAVVARQQGKVAWSNNTQERLRSHSCGGVLEHLHRSPASRKRRQKGNPAPGGITELVSAL
jgi:hypothetical protein